MDFDKERIYSIIERTKNIGIERDLPFLAGSIAFFAFISIFPILLLVLVIDSMFSGQIVSELLFDFMNTYLSDEGEEIVDETLPDEAGWLGASIIGVIVLIWSSIHVFRSFDIAFNMVYKNEVHKPITRQVRDALITILAISLGVALITFIEIALLQVPIRLTIYYRLIGFGVVISGLFILLVPLYYFLPPSNNSIKKILPGTFVAIIGLIILQILFSIYTMFAGDLMGLGYIAVVLLFLLWLYFGALVILIGASVNASIMIENKS